MARPTIINQELVQKAPTLVAQTTDLQELREAQSILLPALHGTTLEETGIPAVSCATVHRLRTRFRRKSRGDLCGQVAWWTPARSDEQEEEEAFLTPWAEQAKDGGILVVSVMRADLSQRLGRPIAASVLYRLLARHGWRKIAPDTRHPKTDPQLQEDWGKDFPRRWMPC